MTERFGQDGNRQKWEPNIWVKLSILRNKRDFEEEPKICSKAQVDFGAASSCYLAQRSNKTRLCNRDSMDCRVEPDNDWWVSSTRKWSGCFDGGLHRIPNSNQSEKQASLRCRMNPLFACKPRIPEHVDVLLMGLSSFALG
jgi:hypothetical protein